MQLINFTMWSPSGGGGAFFSELLDNNYSKDFHLNYDNYRNPTTNEFAGSPNSYRYENYELEKQHNMIPKFTEKSILLGKRYSPLDYFKHEVKCPDTYVIDCKGHEEYVEDLVFVKKIVGGTMQHMTPYFIMSLMQRELENYQFIMREIGSYDKRNGELISWRKYVEMIKSISPYLNAWSIFCLKYFSLPMERFDWDKDEFLMHLKQEHDMKMYSPFLKLNYYGMIDVEPLKEYTNVHVVKYGDLMNGKDTGTAFDDHKKEIHTYFENNTRILDEFEMQCL